MLLQADALHGLIGSELRLRVIDATLPPPRSQRDPVREFAAARIPGSIRFDLDEVADVGADLPHTVPSPDRFAAEVGRLGIGRDSLVVAYDRLGTYSAPRAWWLFRLFGHDRVMVLDGGFPAWLAGGFPVEQGEAPAPSSATFTPGTGRPNLLRTLRQVWASLSDGGELLVDARAAGRFAAAARRHASSRSPRTCSGGPTRPSTTDPGANGADGLTPR